MIDDTSKDIIQQIKKELDLYKDNLRCDIYLNGKLAYLVAFAHSQYYTITPYNESHYFLGLFGKHPIVLFSILEQKNSINAIYANSIVLFDRHICDEVEIFFGGVTFSSEPSKLSIYITTKDTDNVNKILQYRH